MDKSLILIILEIPVNINKSLSLTFNFLFYAEKYFWGTGYGLSMECHPNARYNNNEIQF